MKSYISRKRYFCRQQNYGTGSKAIKWDWKVECNLKDFTGKKKKIKFDNRKMFTNKFWFHGIVFLPPKITTWGRRNCKWDILEMYLESLLWNFHSYRKISKFSNLRIRLTENIAKIHLLCHLSMVSDNISGDTIFLSST